ncbi:MAG TPA: HAMP domain-containing sensor histidine kinase [Vicinamibacteria bacterium]|nr:HAMP domain-containing sensor histidine kinase [Vicinamibacteria bacterium]
MRLLRPPRTAWSVVLMGALLTVLASLQYRWVGELSELEHRRMSGNLRAAADGLGQDLDRDLRELWQTFQPGEGNILGDMNEEYAEWAADFAFPKLIKSVFWVTRNDGLDIKEFNLEEGRFDEASWPPELERIRKPLGELHGSRIDPLYADPLMLVIPQDKLSSQTWAILLLDSHVLVEKLLPARVQEYFGPLGELDYRVWIVDRRDGDRLIYASDPTFERPDLSSPDLERGVFELESETMRPARGGGQYRWAMIVKHQAGSLEAVVESSRRRNLLASFVVVLFFAASVVVLVLNTRRAQLLADQQMDFVTGVSHELRTPIAGVSSLSQNLADGVVGDPGQVREYGKAIHQESRRLANMVDSVLQFSALRSGRKLYQLRPLEPEDAIQRAIDSLGSGVLDSFDFQLDIDEGLPLISGDERALSSAIRNLISNSVKFSQPRARIQVSGRYRAGKDGGEVVLSVEDEGKGIPAAEMPHITKPFYRGRTARNDQVEGSGLGLSIVKDVVEAHGGRLSVSSQPGKGSCFSLHLPVALMTTQGDEVEEAG